MGHVIAPGIGTASLDTFGGLITQANPSDLPEGASPRTWDTDFIVGSVFTRAGLASVYTFTETVTITDVTIFYGVAVFTYIGKQPVINESFVLSGFIGQAAFLNGLTVTVVSSDLSTFTVNLVAPDGTFTNQNGTGTSTTGTFTGPNLGGIVTVVSSGGNVWNNPNGLLGNISEASVITGTSASSSAIPGMVTVVSTGGASTWSNPSNLTATSAVLASVFMLAPDSSNILQAHNVGISIPSDATVVGILTSFEADTNGPAGSSAVSVQLTHNGAPIGTPVVVPISSSLATYTQGSSTYQWGTTLTPSIVNGAPFGIDFRAFLSGSSGSATINAHRLNVTVFYTTAGSSEVLQVTAFNFSMPSTAGVSGFGVSFEAHSTSHTAVTFQMLRNGVPVGSTHAQVLNSTPTVYTLGADNDLWGSTWNFLDINNVHFGVQVVASELGTTFINDLDIIVFLIPGLTNFNYVKSYIQDNNQIDTLALDASGLLWKEDVTNAPGKLAIALTGILPGSFARSATADDREYICFSDLSIGTERPRVFDGTKFGPLSQVGPGSSPKFSASLGSGTGAVQILSWSLTGDVVTFITTEQADPPATGALYTINGVVSYLNGQTLTVLTGATTTSFTAGFVHADDPGGSLTPPGTATLTFGYSIASITQPAHGNFNGQEILWSTGPGNTAPGPVVTFYYGGLNAPENATLLKAFQSPSPVYVYIANAPAANFNGTWLVQSHSRGVPPHESGPVPYFTINIGSNDFQNWGGPGGTGPNGPGNNGQFTITMATLTTSTSIPGLSPGDSLVVTGVTPTAWNSTWTVVQPLNSGAMNILSDSITAGVASYTYQTISPPGFNPIPGETVTITNSTNDPRLNRTGVIATVAGGKFTINSVSGPDVPESSDSAQAITFGTQFTFDPGALVAGTTSNPIFGNAGPGGTVTIVGSSFTPIGAGLRQAVVFFITNTGYETAPSPPVIFDTSADANFIFASLIPIGPPNVIARGIAFTEAGQNGVPGANFYVIPNDVTITVNGTPRTFTSTIVRDNTSTTAKFTFTDAVLLNSQAIDIQGNDLFNLIELGSSAWCVPYASRNFYGLQLNKVQNFNNLTFDGGYNPNPGGGLLTPAGWDVHDTSGDFTLINSPVTGMGLYIFNNTSGTFASAGLLSQTAFQDPFQVPIIQENVTYSVRVACSCPSGVQVGTLQVSLANFIPAIGFGQVYGTFSVPLTSMTTNMQVFTGTLLVTPFTTPIVAGQSAVPSTLVLDLQVLGLGRGADCLIDRIEVFPTLKPNITAQVYGSYVDNLEAIDASGTGGILDTSSENPQDCMGGFVMHDVLYLLKTDSIVSSEDNPSSEPGGWGVKEVSNRVGSIGISSYDTGEEWLVTACRSGIYGFNGGAPTKLMQEIWDLWNKINWFAGNTIVLRNDIVNKRILCAVPLPTPNKWLPFDPLNAAPTSPNVILMLNYQGLGTFEELVNSPEMHTTMFGTLAAVDMKRKWSIWRIKTPYMDFISRQDVEDKPLFVCNGIDSSKIYQFLDDQLSDDGVAINGLYTTYGFVNAAKAATLPIFGFHHKRYTVLQLTSYGSGTEQIRALANTLDARYPFIVPGGLALAPVEQADWFRPLNVRGNRVFLEFSTNAVGEWFNLSKILLSGKADPFTLNPTGGGNLGSGT